MAGAHADVAASGARPAPATAEIPESASTASARLPEEPGLPDSHPRDPKLSLRTDLPLLGAGGGLIILGEALPTHGRLVPLAGLDRSGILLALDRHAVGERHAHAAAASDVAVSAAIAYPFALSCLSASSGERLDAPVRRLVPYLEASLLAEGATLTLKSAVSRPRPFLYLPVSERTPAQLGESPFDSFPSAHASHAFCAAAFAVVDHLRSHPDAGWKEQAVVGFVGGALAATTSLMRVEAGLHFPSDVTAGALIGTAAGTAVPLLHGYDGGTGPAARAPAKSWWASALGLAGGVLAVVLVDAAVE